MSLARSMNVVSAARVQFGRDLVEQALQGLEEARGRLSELPQAFSASRGGDAPVTVALGSDEQNRRRLRLDVLCESEAAREDARSALGDRIEGLQAHYVVTGAIEFLGSRCRPTLPGDSIAHHKVTGGTLGCLVKGRKQRSRMLFALSNHHVLAGPAGAHGDPVLQPGPAYGGEDPADKIGTLAHPIIPPTDDLDAAIARVSPEMTFPKIRRIGRISKQSAVPRLQLPVQKYGDTTGHRRGVLASFVPGQLPVRMDGVLFFFSNVLRFRGVNGLPFADRGDSGSLIVSGCGNHPVALLFAGNTQRNEAFGIPIDVVLRRLGVRIVRTVAEVRKCR